MRQLTIVTSYPLDEPVIGNRLRPFLDVALESGIKIHLISPEGLVVRELEKGRGYHSTVSHKASRKRGFFLRAIDEWRLSGKLLSHPAVRAGDTVLVTIPSMFLLFRASLLRAPARFLDIRDLTWDYLPRSGLVNRLARKVFSALAHRGIEAFSHISCVNRAQIVYLRETMAVPSDRIVFIPNGISQDQFDKLDFSGKHGNGGLPFEVSYVGNVGLAQNLSVLLEVAERLPELQVNIVGGGTDFDRIRDIAERKELSNVRLWGRVSWDRVREIYERTDVLYAQLTHGFEGAVPSKLYEYLATGKPVIYGGLGEAVITLAEFENVKCVPPDDVDSLVREFTSLLERKGSLGFSQANRKRVEKHFIRENHVSEWFSRVGLVPCPSAIRDQT